MYNTIGTIHPVMLEKESGHWTSGSIKPALYKYKQEKHSSNLKYKIFSNSPWPTASKPLLTHLLPLRSPRQFPDVITQLTTVFKCDILRLRGFSLVCFDYFVKL